jgi:hypothetical protein
MDSPGLVLVLLAFAAVFVLVLSALTFVPAYILWRKTKDKRYPMIWVTCSALIVLGASIQAFWGRDFVPWPQPINETLNGVADKTGTLRVTALRLPNPEQQQVRIEVDAENTSGEQQLLGIQCTTSNGPVEESAPKQTTTHYIWTVEPKWKGTLTCEAQLPGILHDGNVAVVLARCKSKTPGPNNWLPADSEALYQNRFSLLPEHFAESTQ